MLVLTRKLGESVLIGDAILLRVVELRRSRVRIGIEAPPNVRILRGELPLQTNLLELDVLTPDGESLVESP
ncbi:MAG: carbon storage regulator [Planctomycetes bacterium]|nr:carbon storage regulator [Planctomycetota bacterium]